MASASNDKGKKPLEEDHHDPKLKEGMMTGGSRAREPIFEGSINAGRAFSHNMQGPIPPIPDLSSFPAAEEALCDKDHAGDPMSFVPIFHSESNQI
jgi:hypothetical protein